MDAGLRSVLVLQEREARRIAAERELKSVPREVAAVEARIAGDKAAIESARKSVRDVELRTKQVESSIRTAEERGLKLKAQQALVKKNDEYQALTKEIAAAEEEASRLSEDEIRLLYEVDEARSRGKSLEAVHVAAIREHEARISGLRERERVLEARVAEETAAVAAARQDVPEELLRIYDRLLKGGKLPVAVPVQSQTCGGCHLRVSNGVEMDARRGTKLATCDNCGRIVFVS